MDCCANKRCCLESQKKQHELPKLPLTQGGGSNQQLVAIVAARLTTDQIQFPKMETSSRSSAMHVTLPAPQLALLCTFLI
jgi:hypothetical protein